MSIESRERKHDGRHSHKTDPITFEMKWEDIEYVSELSKSDEYSEDWSSTLEKILQEHREEL